MARAATGRELTSVDGSTSAGVAAASAEGPASGFYLAPDDPRAVGRALRWATAGRLERVHLLAEHHAGDLARRASLLSDEPAPAITVLAVDGATVAEAPVEAIAAAPDLPESHWVLAGVMTEAGARPVADHDVLIAEVAGLEVARVVDYGEGPRLEIGVGQADRELNQLVHRGAEPGDDLRRVVAAVASYRNRVSNHPLTRVGRERWLRSLLLEDPSIAGAESLEPIPPLRPRRGLKDDEPAAASGTLTTGRSVVVVTMAGVDLDLVPEAADYRARTDPHAAIVLAMPGRDVALSTTLVSRLHDTTILPLDPPWT